MTAERRSRRSMAHLAILLSVGILFGAATFVAGMSVGGAGVALGPSPSATAEATPRPTPAVETVTCAAPTDAFELLCEVYGRIESDYVDELDASALVEGGVEGM